MQALYGNIRNLYARTVGLMPEHLRRKHVTPKSHRTKGTVDIYGAIAFLIPTLASVLILILRDADFQAAVYPGALVLIVVSAGLLVLSFISALRAMTIKYSQLLFLNAVIEEDSGMFRKYEIEFQAKGLLYCAVMNTAINDHMAQFVKGAYTLLAIAVICFAWGVGIIGLNLGTDSDLRLDVLKTEAVSGSCSGNGGPQAENIVSHTKDHLDSKGGPGNEPERICEEADGVGVRK